MAGENPHPEAWMGAPQSSHLHTKQVELRGRFSHLPDVKNLWGT